MKKTATIFLLLLIGLSLNSCKVFNKESTFDTNIIGTKWAITYTIRGSIERNYEIHFLENAKLLNTHPNDVTKDNDKWNQNKRKITMTFNDEYSIFKGEMISPNKMTGTAKNEKGVKWKWEAVLLK